MKHVICIAAALLVSGCIRTTEMPLAANVVRIQTEAHGALFTGQTQKQTMRKAAELTLARGYTHFKLTDTSMESGQEFVGMTSSTANTTYDRRGRTVYGNTTYTPGVPMYDETATAGATVVMYRAGEPGAADALDAAEILRLYPA